MKILLAIDGSEGATTAVLGAARLLQLKTSEAHVLCMAPPWVLSSEGRVDIISRLAYEHQVTVEAAEAVHRTGALLRKQGIETIPIVKMGSPADVIVRTAIDGEYDVTVVGAYGQNEGKGPGLGHVASTVLDRVPGTVLIGRELFSESESGFSVLAAVDGSAASERAVRKLAEQFSLTAVEITLLFVKETLWMEARAPGEEWPERPAGPVHRVDFEQELRTELRREAGVALTSARQILAGFGVGCHSLIREGNPAEEILSEAEADGYDLIVLGAKGVTDLKHVMLGSVSAEVARNAPCSVAIVKAW